MTIVKYLGITIPSIVMRIQMNILIEKKDLEKIKKIANSRGQDYSDFVRFVLKKELALFGFLTKDEVRFLGLSN